jgi:hypothetical protein
VAEELSAAQEGLSFMRLVVTETFPIDQGIYFPERPQINEESISFIYDINMNVEIMSLHHFHPNCGKKSLYMSVSLLFMGFKEMFWNYTVTYTLNLGPQ